VSVFTPRVCSFHGRLVLPLGVDDAFRLFSPQAEKLWVPDWNPEFLYPGAITWERGQLFRTREERGEAVWIITALDREQHRVEYHRVEPGRYVAHIVVRCDSLADQEAEVLTAYSYVGLSVGGNQEISGMTQEAYAAKMRRWTEWIGRSLARET